MPTEVKFLEDLIQHLVEFRSRLSDVGDIQVVDASLSVAEEHLQAIESED